MSEPCEPDPVKLIVSLFAAEKKLIDEVIDRLSELFGPPDWISPELLFDRTKYYARELGWPLHRRFVSFAKLIPADHLVDIKLKTNEVERQFMNAANRRINVDPGFISPERLVLATGKNYGHRIYLTKGIYADLTLVFRRGTFHPLDWTYPDYADPETVGYFDEVRKGYMNQLREMRRLD